MAIPGFEPTTWLYDEAAVIEPFWYPGLAADLAAMAEISAPPGFITGDWSVEYPPIAEPITWAAARLKLNAPEAFPAAAMRDSSF